MSECKTNKDVEKIKERARIIGTVLAFFGPEPDIHTAAALTLLAAEIIVDKTGCDIKEAFNRILNVIKLYLEHTCQETTTQR